MMYDGAGRRISKTLLTKSAAATGWDTVKVTHYTGIGTEIREYKPSNYVRFTDSLGVEHCVSANPDYSGNAPTTCPLPDTIRAVVPMPQGLGRYALQNTAYEDSSLLNAYEFYLKDHLGSTRMVYGIGYPDPLGLSPDGELRAAYDYRSFGEQIDLALFTRKVTENFTGKELDDEIELGYWGARYLDLMLGVWISVDPKRQFASPYLYAGNGYNPVNGADEDGNYFRYADKATEHAVMQYVQHISPEAKFRFSQLAASKYRYDILKVDGAQIDPDDGEPVGGLAKPWTYETGESGGAAYFSNIDFFLHEVLTHLYDVDNSLKGNFGDVNATAKEIDLNRNEWEERAREFEKQTTEDAEDE